jgi:hypothetical protein
MSNAPSLHALCSAVQPSYLLTNQNILISIAYHEVAVTISGKCIVIIKNISSFT